MSIENQNIGSNNNPKEIARSDEETPKTPMETNTQQEMVTEREIKTEADIVNEEDLDPVEHSKQIVLDSLDNLFIAEKDQPYAIESSMQKNVSTYRTIFNTGYLNLILNVCIHVIHGQCFKWTHFRICHGQLLVLC